MSGNLMNLTFFLGGGVEVFVNKLWPLLYERAELHLRLTKHVPFLKSLSTNFEYRIKEQWVRVGPPNKRCYDVLNIPDKGKADLKPASVDLVRSCVNFLSSGMFLLG